MKHFGASFTLDFSISTPVLHGRGEQPASVWVMNTTRYLRHVREKRLAAGLSQQQLAVRLQLLGLDVDHMWVSHLERGDIRPTWEMLPFLACALETDPNELVQWDDFVRLHRS